MATFKIVLDTRVKKRKDEYNLAIRIIVGSEQVYLNISKLTKDQYNHVFEKKSMDIDSVEFRESCNEYLAKSERVFLNLKTFNKKKYRELFYGTEKVENDSLLLKDLFDRFILNYTSLKPKTVAHFKYCKSVFETYSPNICVTDVSSKYINQFIKDRLNSGVSQSTVNSSLRDLRRIINYFSNEESIIPKDYKYPFGKGGVSIQNYFPRKLVMSNNEIKSIIDLQKFDSKDEEYARDIWEMLYRCNGINFADLLRMRWDNIQGEYLVFFRKKTETTRKNNKKEIIVPINPSLEELIKKVGDKESPFILGKLKEGYLDSTFENKSQKLKKSINTNLDKVGKGLNLKISLRIKTARDSYATTLRRAGVAKDDIGEMLGHSNSIVTEHYLASIDMESTFEINKHLL